MATLKRSRKKCKIIQWCNDWISIETEDGESKIVSPSALFYTNEEFHKIIYHKNNGILFQLYEADQKNQTFIKIKK